MTLKGQSYRNLKSLAEAQQIFFSRFGNTRVGTEILPVRDSFNRLLARSVKAVRSVPAYNAAAVDGLAVRASDTYSALPETPVFLSPGTEAIPVNTGDPLPDGTNAVVMIERVELTDDRYEIREAVYPWQNVRKTGEDIVKGEILFPAYHQIRAYDQSALLAAGVLSVEVFRKPRVLIIPTGDEIVAPEKVHDPIQPGVILEVNGQMLASMAADCGAEATLANPVPDDFEKIKQAIMSGVAAGYDVILIIAGSSAGSEDFTPAVLSQVGELLVHGITVMPGKPTLLASVANCPVVGIPGYPVSAFVSFREFVRPLLYRLQGLQAPQSERVEASIGRKLPSKAGLEEHVRVIMGRIRGRTVAIPLTGGAGIMTSLTRADGILRIPPESSGLSEGEKVSVELLTPLPALEHRLLAIGSHDLAIDLLAGLLKERSEGKITISSSNVGSMGGLLAVDRGIAHLAGSHLLDRQSGEYNRPFVARYIKSTRVQLVTLVHRWQGLIVAKGNPKNIRGIGDLTRSDISLINRQPGSGTRILLDYELEKAGIDPSSVAGYRNEEYTHMSVAMAVASGRADVGMGILAAAHALDLDFIPVTRERYDLVIPIDLFEDQRIKLLLEIIRSSAFTQQVLALGGYEVEETGRIQAQ